MTCASFHPDAEVQALTADGGMHVRGVAGEEHAPIAVARGLTGHVGETREPRRAAEAEVSSVERDERLAELARGRRVALLDLLLAEDDADALAVFVPAERVGAFRVAAHAEGRLLGHLDVGDHVAHRRVPSGNSMPAVLRTRLRPPSQPTR